MGHYLTSIKQAPLWWWPTVLISAASVGVAMAYLPYNYVLAAIVGFICLIAVITNPVMGVYWLTFFLPFERIGSVDVVGITIRISQVLAILTIVAWCGRGLKFGSFKLRPYPILLPILAFMAVACVSLVHAPNLVRSLTVLIFILFTICVSIMLPNVIRHTAQIERLVHLLLLSMCVVSLFGLFQFLGDIVGLPTSLTGLRDQYTKEILGFPRVQSTALEPLYFANYLLIPLASAAALWLSKSSRLRSWWLIGLIMLGGVNFILTVSRGGYIALAITGVCLGLVYWKQLLRPAILVPLILGMAIVGGVAYRFLNLTKELDSFTTHVTDVFAGASYEERVETFDIAERIWLQHPWIGIGPGSFGPYASYHPLIVPSEGYKIVNNEYIELLAETGILGLSCFILMVIMLYLRSWKALRHGTDPFLKALLIGLLAAFTGILVQYNTFSVLYIMHIWFTIGLMISVQNILLHGDYQ